MLSTRRVRSGRHDVGVAGGTSIGGARPKALLDDSGTGLIAKFPSTTDTCPVVHGEFVAMSLAARCGLDVAGVRIISTAGRFALLVERLDRPGGDQQRRFCQH